MKMKRIISVLFALVLSVTVSSTVKAQIFGGPDFMKGKMVAGGIFNAGYSSGCLHLGIAPQFGYRLTRSLEIGVRVGYDLYHYYNSPYYGRYNSHFFSGALYANFEIFQGIFVHVEDEESCMLVRGNALNPTTPNWYNSAFVGGGYRQYTSANSYVYFAFLYNLSWSYAHPSESPYVNPFVIRTGYCIGF